MPEILSRKAVYDKFKRKGLKFHFNIMEYEAGLMDKAKEFGTDELVEVHRRVSIQYSRGNHPLYADWQLALRVTVTEEELRSRIRGRVKWDAEIQGD